MFRTVNIDLSENDILCKLQYWLRLGGGGDNPLKGRNQVMSTFYRFPRLFPQLTEETVAKKSLAAILTDRKQIVLPWYFNTFVIMKRYRHVYPVGILVPK